MEDLLRFAKPPPFDGHEGQWSEWSFQMKAFLSLDNEQMHTLLAAAEQQDAPIDLNGLTPANRLLSRRIFYIMTMTLRGAPLGLLKSTPDQNGLEAWRLLYARYEGTSAGRQHSLLSAVLCSGRTTCTHGSRRSHDGSPLRKTHSETQSAYRSS